MIDRAEARRLYVRLIPTIRSLDARLFESTEGDLLGVDPRQARRQVPQLVTKAGDLLMSLANLDPVAGGFREECVSAVKQARADPFDTVELEEEGGGNFPPPEEYTVLLKFRELAERLALIYGLHAAPEDYAFSVEPQKALYRICGEIGFTIEHLIRKNVIGPPSREDDVKHVLYSTCRAVFPDALPDGQIKFPKILKGYKPDLGVPGLKTCVELKLARTPQELATVLDQIVVDTSAYGSETYTTFISAIYTNDPTVTLELVNDVIADQHRVLGANPIYAWAAIVAFGPLRP